MIKRREGKNENAGSSGAKTGQPKECRDENEETQDRNAAALSANDIAAQLLSSASGRRFAAGELALGPQIIPHSSQRDVQCTF